MLPMQTNKTETFRAVARSAASFFKFSPQVAHKQIRCFGTLRINSLRGASKHVAIACAAILTACGGGGGGGDSNTSAPASQPLAATAPAATTPGCTPLGRPVQYTIAGDSTNAGKDGATGTYDVTPAMLMQSLMDARFGAGAVVVTSIAVPGSTSNDLAPSQLTGDITIVNFGINDSAISRLGATDSPVPIANYRLNLRALHATVLQTPNPTYRDIRPLAATEAYAQAMREVAAETGTPVADVTPYVLGLPGWQALVADGIHPTGALYAAIQRDVIFPVVAPMVARLLCQ